MQLYLHKPLADAAERDLAARAVVPNGRDRPPPRPARARAYAARLLAGSALRLDREAARRAVA